MHTSTRRKFVRCILLAACVLLAACGGCREADGDNNEPSACGDLVCSADATCVDDECHCRPGFEGDGETCSEIVVACDDDASCGVQGSCEGGFCVCEDGFALSTTGCEDADECASQTHDCDPAATCMNTEGGFLCTCPGGAPGDGRTCEPFDECAAEADDCVGDHVVCVDLDDGYECACDDGYTGDGETCSLLVDCDADPAACDENATCTDTADGTACVCDEGYAGDGASCRLTGFTTIVGAESTVCGLRPDQTMACWGRMIPGATMLQSLHGATRPTPEPSGFSWTNLDVHTYGVVAVRDDGTIWRAGNNDEFKELDSANDWVDIRVGTDVLDHHYCGIRTDETLWCWGENGSGQVGVGGTDDIMEPTQVGGASWKLVELGHARSCGVQTDGTLWCWGGAGVRGEEIFSRVPQQVGTDTDWASVRMRGFDNVALKEDGRAYTWHGHVPEPVQEVAETWKAFGRGNYAWCGVRTDGTLWCRGANVYGALGVPDAVQTGVDFIQVGDDADWSDLVITAQHFCALKESGDAFCWGRNPYGQVGVGTRPVEFEPTVVAAGASHSAVSISESHSCAIRSDGALACAGDNTLNALGLPVTEVFGLPEFQVVHPGPWERVAVGGQHTCVVSSGRLYCLGATNAGQSGRGQNATPTHELIAVDEATDWEDVFATTSSTCALKSDGSLYCWGQNQRGVLGTGDMEVKWAPTKIGDGTWKQVALSAQGSPSHSCAIASDDTLWCWGNNDSGQLGTGDNEPSLIPIQIDGSAWKSVSVGFGTTFGVKADGTMWWWGDLIVHGEREPVLAPKQIGTGSDWLKIAATQGHACAIRDAGALFCWGQTRGGATGDPGMFNAGLSEPTRVGTSSNWTDVQVTGQASCGMQSGGVLSCWGSELTGNLGYGTAWYGSPQRVRD